MTGIMNFATKTRYRIEYTGFMGAVGLIRLMPLETASRTVGWLFRKLAPLGKRHKRAHKNIARAMPELSADRRAEILNEMWDTIGRITAETVQIDRMAAQFHRIDVTRCNELALDIIARDKGSISVSMHSGNWEVSPAPGRAHNLEPATLYQSVKNPYVDKYLRACRSHFAPGGTFSKGHSTARMLVTFLRKGGHLGLLADQRERKGISVPFFGLEASTLTIHSLLAIKLNVPLVAVRVIRHPGVKFTIEAEEITVVKTGDQTHDVYETTKRVNAIFEKWIREYPGQWMWGHRRWEDDAKPMS